MINKGKAFEEDFKKSIPDKCWVYRLRDSSGAWTNLGNGENTRFTPSNICDYFVVSPKKVYLLELKSYDSMSIPISGIRKSQLEGLTSIDKDNIKAYFILNFRKIERTYAITADKVKKFIENTERKSIPIQYAIEHGIEITAEQKRTRFRYNLEELFGI